MSTFTDPVYLELSADRLQELMSLD
jgi:hypothetical protein